MGPTALKRLLAATFLSVLNATLGPPNLAKGQVPVLPPSWRTSPPSGMTYDQGDILGEGNTQNEAPRGRARKWYQPKAALGVGANIPELLPIEGFLFFGRFIALRAFYTPPLPINIRVEMPSDVISARGGIAVANPAFTIRGKATYGAHYGLEALVFPFGGSFFLSSGISHRRMRLVANASSPVLVCSALEAQKDPPCGDGSASIQTRTEIKVDADVETEALLLRAALGGFWHVGNFGYFTANIGATKPTSVKRHAQVSAALTTPESDNPEITGALAQIRSEREKDLQDKALGQMRPVDEKILPILGIGAGVRF